MLKNDKPAEDPKVLRGEVESGGDEVGSSGEQAEKSCCATSHLDRSEKVMCVRSHLAAAAWSCATCTNQSTESRKKKKKS